MGRSTARPRNRTARSLQCDREPLLGCAPESGCAFLDAGRPGLTCATGRGVELRRDVQCHGWAGSSRLVPFVWSPWLTAASAARLS